MYICICIYIYIYIYVLCYIYIHIIGDVRLVIVCVCLFVFLLVGNLNTSHHILFTPHLALEAVWTCLSLKEAASQRNKHVDYTVYKICCGDHIQD